MWIAGIAITLALIFFAVYFIGHVLFEILKPIASLETFAQLHGPSALEIPVSVSRKISNRDCRHRQRSVAGVILTHELTDFYFSAP
jgi:hypothetical protein